MPAEEIQHVVKAHDRRAPSAWSTSLRHLESIKMTIDYAHRQCNTGRNQAVLQVGFAIETNTDDTAARQSSHVPSDSEFA